MKLPLPTDYARCMAHPPGYSLRAAPIDWCHLRDTCARHQSIMVDVFEEPYSLQPCLCSDELKRFYIEAEA